MRHPDLLWCPVCGNGHRGLCPTCYARSRQMINSDLRFAGWAALMFCAALVVAVLAGVYLGPGQ